MPELIAAPASLELLRSGLINGASVGDLALPLRALQQRGMQQLDLVLNIERIRVENELGGNENEIEERCLEALDLVYGGGSRHSLKWDAATKASALLPRALSGADIEAAVDNALTPSDLLPPRDSEVNPALRQALGNAAAQTLIARELHPSACSLVRVPKGSFTSRPAAVLGFPERLALEALANLIAPELADALPDQVTWPRGRERISMQVATDAVESWGARYVVKADVANFYEEVEHSLLAVFLATRLNLNGLIARATEALLTASMGFGRGLPQGPVASDLLASAYLFPIDAELAASDLPFVRFADDYFFPAESLAEGRATIARLEALLNDVGLALSTEKSAVMRREKFVEGVDRPEVRAFKERTVQAYLDELGGADDYDEQMRIAAGVGLDEQTVWDFLYHGSVDAEEVIESLVGEDVEAVGAVHRVYLTAVAAELRAADRSESLQTLHRVARESLAVLAASDVPAVTKASHFAVTLRDLATVQLWFPELAPSAATFLVTRVPDTPDIGRYTSLQLRHLSGSDWVNSWSAYAAGLLPGGAVSTRRLQAVLRSPRAGPLTKAEAARAMLRQGTLSEGVWRRVCDSVPRPIRAELVFAAIVEPDRPDWLRRFAGEAIPPALHAFREHLLTE